MWQYVVYCSDTYTTGCSMHAKKRAKYAIYSVKRAKSHTLRMCIHSDTHACLTRMPDRLIMESVCPLHSGEIYNLFLQSFSYIFYKGFEKLINTGYPQDKCVILWWEMSFSRFEKRVRNFPAFLTAWETRNVPVSGCVVPKCHTWALRVHRRTVCKTRTVQKCTILSCNCHARGPIVNNLTGVPGEKGVENGVGPSSTTPANYRPLFLRHISTLCTWPWC